MPYPHPRALVCCLLSALTLSAALPAHGSGPQPARQVSGLPGYRFEHGGLGALPRFKTEGQKTIQND